VAAPGRAGPSTLGAVSLGTSCAIGLGALVLLPAVAAADSRLGLAQGALTFFSEDVAVGNRLLAEDSAQGLRLFDPADPAGMRFADVPCDPGRLNEQANVIEVFCDTRALRRLDVDVGDGEDDVDYRARSLPVTLSGQLGADRLRTGETSDVVRGGQGDDAIATGGGADRAVGGAGADRVDLGAGDDGAQVADGEPDSVTCGAGYDTVLADTADTVWGCENVAREKVAGAPPPEDDVTPVLRARIVPRQRISPRRRYVAVVVSASEPALVRASGFLVAGGLNSRVALASVAVGAAGQQRRLVVRLSRGQVARAMRDLRRAHRPRLRLALTAVDRAGNTSAARRVTVRPSR
jgi:RTX calcium-binding nonapeptide repeat (4 copies)